MGCYDKRFLRINGPVHALQGGVRIRLVFLCFFVFLSTLAQQVISTTTTFSEQQDFLLRFQVPAASHCVAS